MKSHSNYVKSEEKKTHRPGGKIIQFIVNNKRFIILKNEILCIFVCKLNKQTTEKTHTAKHTFREYT